MINPFLMATLLGFKHALDPDHLAAIFNMTLSSKINPRSAAKLGASWGIGHAVSMAVLGLPVVLFTSSLPEAAYTSAELAIGLVIIYLATALYLQWFRGEFHPHNLSNLVPTAINHKKNHRRAGLMGALHGVGGSYPAALLMISSFTTTAAAAAGLAAFTLLSIVSMTIVTTVFSYVTLHHKFMHLLDRAFIPLVIISTLIFGIFYVESALKALNLM